MTDQTTIARPYAKAVFELACERGELAAWSGALELVSAAVVHAQMRDLLDDPRRTSVERAALLLRLFREEPGLLVRNFVRLLSENGRLDVLPDIALAYEALRAEAEGTVEVELRSVEPVSEESQARIVRALRARLGREVHMTNVVDETLIGGAVIRAGDLVIDGSLRARLDKLAGTLAA